MLHAAVGLIIGDDSRRDLASQLARCLTSHVKPLVERMYRALLQCGQIQSDGETSYDKSLSRTHCNTNQRIQHKINTKYCTSIVVNSRNVHKIITIVLNDNINIRLLIDVRLLHSYSLQSRIVSLFHRAVEHLGSKLIDRYSGHKQIVLQYNMCARHSKCGCVHRENGGGPSVRRP